MGDFVKSAGAGISGVMSMVGGSRKTKNYNDALKSERNNTMTAADYMKQGDTQASKLYQPYQDLSPQALATLQSAIYGGPQQYVDANGVSQTANYMPQESEGFQWQKAKTLKDLGRQLRSNGRENSTYGMNAYGDAIGRLNSNYENTQFQRLGGLADLGQWGTQQMANTKYTTGTNLGSLYSSLGKSQAAGYRALGDARAENWNNGAKWNYQAADNAGNGLKSLYGF